MIRHLKAVFGAGLLALASQVQAEQSVLPLELTQDIQALGQNPTLLKVVNRHNLKVINMAQIKRRDNIWRQSPKGRILIDAAMRNPASITLKKFAEERPYLQSVTLQDRRGINVAMDKPAKHYWVGNHDAWLKPIETGESFVAETDALDEEDRFVKVSTPILSDGKAIGVLMVSLDTSAI